MREQKAKKKAAKKKQRKKAEGERKPNMRAAGASGDDVVDSLKKMKKATRSFKDVAAGAGGKSPKPAVSKGKKKKKKKRDKSAVRSAEWNWEHCVGEIVGAIDSVADGAEIDEVGCGAR